MLRIFLLFMLMIALFQNRVNAQVQMLNYQQIKGKVKDATNQTSLPDVYILQWQTGKINATRFDGSFQITVSPGDSIQFRCMGYVDTLLICRAMDDSLIVNLQPKTIELDEVVVRRFRSYADFTYQFQNLKIKTNKSYKVEMPFSNEELKAEIRAKAGCYGIALRMDKKIIERRRFNAFVEEQAKYERIEDLTSYANVRELTGLRDAPLDSFMIFLRTRYKFTAEDSDYKTLETVLLAFHQFCSINDLPGCPNYKGEVD